MNKATTIFGTLFFNWMVLVPFTYFLLRQLSPSKASNPFTSMIDPDFVKIGCAYGLISGVLWFRLHRVQGQAMKRRTP